MNSTPIVSFQSAIAAANLSVSVNREEAIAKFEELKAAEKHLMNRLGMVEEPVTYRQASPFEHFLSPQHEEQLFEEFLAKYRSAVCTELELENKDVKTRQRLMGNWMKEGDLGFIHGERGSGKTWLVTGIAGALSTGRDLDNWQVPSSVNVFLIDGEMPIDDFIGRIKGVCPKNPLLHLLHHEQLCDTTGLVMNLTDQKTQRVITALCLEKKIKLLILDNLSCLFSDLKENEADEWEKVLNWLLDLRRRRIAVCL